MASLSWSKFDMEVEWTNLATQPCLKSFEIHKLGMVRVELSHVWEWTKVAQAPVIAWRDAWSRSCIKSAGGHWSQFPAAALLDAAFTALVSSSSKEHESPLVWSCSEAPSPVSETLWCSLSLFHFFSVLLGGVIIPPVETGDNWPGAVDAAPLLTSSCGLGEEEDSQCLWQVLLFFVSLVHLSSASSHCQYNSSTPELQ